MKDNAEARTIKPTGHETVSLMPSQQDLAAFWQDLKLSGSTKSREQEMFSQGYMFGNLESLYGGSGAGIGADNYLTEKGTISRVGLVGTSPMSELKAKDQGDRQAGQQPEKATLSTPEGQQVRNASGEQVRAIKAANPNVSDGSVRNWAMMTQAEKFAHVEKTGQDHSFELVDHESSGKDAVIAARQMFAGVEAKSASPAQVQELSEVDNRPIKDYGWQAKQHGQDKVIETGLEYQAGKTPEITAQGLFEKIGALPLEQQAQVIGAGIKAYSGELSHQQFRIGVGAITGLGDGIVGLAQGAESLGKAVIGVAQFSRDVMANDPSAVETAEKVGESVGKLLVGGIRVYSAAEGYLESVGAATNVGDYGKALRDVAWLGQQMNSRWESMSPEEKTKLVIKLSVENFGGLALGFGADKLAKSVKITEALEALGSEASTMGAGVREKAKKPISSMTNELMPQLLGVTPDGHLMPIPKAEGRFEDLSAKMVGRSGEYVPERKPMFLAPGQNKVLNEREIESFGGLKKLESMSDGELAAVGLRRYELPKLKLESDEFSLQAKVSSDPQVWCRASVPEKGTVVVTDIVKGALPDGTGNHLIAATLKAHNAIPTEKLVFKQVVEPRTVRQLHDGVAPAETVMGKMGIKAMKELGLTPTTCTMEVVRDKINITIGTK